MYKCVIISNDAEKTSDKSQCMFITKILTKQKQRTTSQLDTEEAQGAPVSLLCAGTVLDSPRIKDKATSALPTLTEHGAGSQCCKARRGNKRHADEEGRDTTVPICR